MTDGKKSDEEEDATPTPRLFSPTAQTRKVPVVEVMRPTTPRWERSGPITRPPQQDSLKPRTEHIIVVDDEHDVRETLMFMLTEEGYSVRGAIDGLEALEMVFGSSELPDCVLLDIGLPKISGVGVKACIEAEMGTRGLQMLPVVVITAGSVSRLPPSMKGDRTFEKNRLGDLTVLLATIRKDIAAWREYLQRT